MPFEIKWNRDFVLFDYFGKVTSRELVKSNELVYGDSRFDSLRWELVHFDRAENVKIVERDIRLIAYMDQAAFRSNPNITVAFIGKTSVLDDVEKLYRISGSAPTWPQIHFESYDEAIAYITQKES